MMRRTSGVTLIELLVVILLTSVLAHAASRLLVAQGAAVRRMVHRSDVLAAARQTRLTLGWEARGGRLGVDPFDVSETALALRAYRGFGRICGVAPDRRTVHVAVDGVRFADPDKDSVRVVGWAPGTVVLALEGESPSAAVCAGAVPASVRTWVLAAPLPPGVSLVRYFERGRYALARGALRYGRGVGGLQPMTPEVLAEPPGRFLAGRRAVEVHLSVTGRDPLGWTFAVSPRRAPGG